MKVGKDKYSSTRQDSDCKFFAVKLTHPNAFLWNIYLLDILKLDV